MLVAAFTRHLRKNPMSDADIVEGLSWIKQMVDGVLQSEEADSIHLHQHAEVNA